MLRNPPATRACRIALAALLLAAGPGMAQDGVASLAAELSFHDPDDRAPVRPVGGEPVGLRVTLTDLTTDRPPRGMTLAGWIRPDEPGNASCEDAARAFRVTARPPIGSTDLNGVLLVTLNEDASVGVIDPKLNLQSSNMIAAAKLDRLPRAMAVDPERQRALFATVGEPGIQSMSLLTGQTARIAPQHAAVTDIAASKAAGTWAGTADGGVFRPDDPAGTIPVGTPGNAVLLRLSSDPESPLLAAFGAAGGLLVLDGGSGATILSDADFPALEDVAVFDRGAVLALPRGGQAAKLVYPDAPDRVLSIPLGFAATRIRASPDGRFAIAHAPGGPIAAIIDIARAEVVQPVALTAGTISEVAFTDEAAYLLSLDGGFAGLIDLATIAIGRGAQIRRIDLARKSDAPKEDARLLVPLWPSPQVLAVSPQTQTGLILHDDQSRGEMPPMDSIRLRGGVPFRVAVVDRSLQEVAPGVFETVAAIQGGRHELVLTTGIGGMTTCLGFDVRGGAPGPPVEILSLSVTAEDGTFNAGQDEGVAIVIHGDTGAPVPVERAEFLVPSLSSSWVGRLRAQRGADGVLRGRVRFPHAGPFAVQPLALPPGVTVKSAILLEVAS